MLTPEQEQEASNKELGFITLYRSVKNHWLYEHSRKRTKYEAWLDLLLKTTYKTEGTMIGYNKIEVKRGDILTSQENLASDWRWDRSAVRSFLHLLQSEKMISVKTTSKFTMITVCKYDSYNQSSPTKQLPNNINTTSKQHQLNTYNKDNKDNKENKEKEEGSKEFTPPSISEFLEYFSTNSYTAEIGEKAFRHYELGNWKDTAGKQVKNWKRKVNTVWFKPEHKIQKRAVQF